MPLRRRSLCIVLGEIQDRGLEKSKLPRQRTGDYHSGDHVVNTVYIERAIGSLKRKGFPINEQLVSHLSPTGWEHINLN